ncbi:MAG: tRNA (adenosine(37)-N6)-dimethylallyltransferase MiaA [Myxococcota bacterium]
MRPRVLALVGLTGTGKSEIACEIARRVTGEILSADSMQVYRGMDIGTAKPSRTLRREIPHHGIDLVDPDEAMSAGAWATHARAAAHSAHARGHPVILCGGTGLYARAFAGGLVPGVEADPRVRSELAGRTLEDLRSELEKIDPLAAQRIHPHDRVRTERAIEVTRRVGRAVSRQRAEHAFGDSPFEVRWCGLALPRERLWPRLRARVDEMFGRGWVDEVRALAGAGYGPELPALRSIGYREIHELLAGRRSEAETREAIWVATRRYAKRQRTWFRAQPGLRWIDAEDPGPLVEWASRWLSGEEGRG